jgi:hypothetical protein
MSIVCGVLTVCFVSTLLDSFLLVFLFLLMALNFASFEYHTSVIHSNWRLEYSHFPKKCIKDMCHTFDVLTYLKSNHSFCIIVTYFQSQILAVTEFRTIEGIYYYICDLYMKSLQLPRQCREYYTDYKESNDFTHSPFIIHTFHITHTCRCRNPWLTTACRWVVTVYIAAGLVSKRRRDWSSGRLSRGYSYNDLVMVSELFDLLILWIHEFSKYANIFNFKNSQVSYIHIYIHVLSTYISWD